MPATALAPALADTPAEILPGLAELIAAELAPKVVDIDLKGLYPGDFLKQLGALGGLGSLTPVEHGGTALGLGHAIQLIEDVSKECVSTGFLLWAEYALQWYVINSSNRALAAEMLPKMARGEVLGGTAQSNSMKSCAGIEEARLKATRVDGGYRINGVLPWVSNIGLDHYFHMGATLPDTPGLVIGLMHGSTPGLTLAQNAHFIGMEGTNTFACQFRDVFLPDSRVVCHAGRVRRLPRPHQVGFHPAADGDGARPRRRLREDDAARRQAVRPRQPLPRRAGRRARSRTRRRTRRHLRAGGEDRTRRQRPACKGNPGSCGSRAAN
jgi:alkylation response protein AidB-like acyl-CoA dehydrogenase